MDKWIVFGGAAAAVLLMTRKTDAAPGVANPSKVQRVAEAIAYAEGFHVAGSIPARNHNPGDLKVSAVPNVGSDAQGHLKFASDADGWAALRRQLELIIAGRSSNFRLDMTIAEMGLKYAEWGGAWAHNVAARLSVTEGTTLRAVLT